MTGVDVPRCSRRPGADRRVRSDGIAADTGGFWVSHTAGSEAEPYFGDGARPPYIQVRYSPSFPSPTWSCRSCSPLWSYRHRRRRKRYCPYW